MRRPFIAGNWKMNLGVEDAGTLAADLASACASIRDVDIAVAPTEICLTTVLSALKDSGIHVASQNHYHVVKGAYTGEVSPVMLRQAGCAYALIGHSERRTLFGETNTTVQQKISAAFDAGLLPILCIGETLEEREAGNAESIVQEQLNCIEGLQSEQIAAITIAYEPYGHALKTANP